MQEISLGVTVGKLTAAEMITFCCGIEVKFENFLKILEKRF